MILTLPPMMAVLARVKLSLDIHALPLASHAFPYAGTARRWELKPVMIIQMTAMAVLLDVQELLLDGPVLIFKEETLLVFLSVETVESFLQKLVTTVHLIIPLLTR